MEDTNEKNCLHPNNDTPQPIDSPQTNSRSLQNGTQAAPSSKKTLSNQTSRRRLWIFRICTIFILPILVICLLELGLRIAGYGFPTKAVIKCKIDGTDTMCNNFKFAWRFFPPNIAREFYPFTFSAEKDSNTYRIFVLGGSAALGTPNEAYSFGRILRVMLRQKYPEVNFEVVTAAMVAINSHVVLPIAKDCAQHSPDLFVVYLGNNEVVGPYGAGTAFTPLSDNLPLIRLGISIKAARLGQLITNLADSISNRGKTPMFWKGPEMFMQNLMPHYDPRLQTVYENFQKNLQDIGQVALKKNASAIFCTLATNLRDSSPFTSVHRTGLTEQKKKQFDQIYQKAIELENTADYTQAIKHYLSAAEIDDFYAELYFRLGRCYWAIHEYTNAKDAFIKARELDALRLRADDKINDIIREAAAQNAADRIYLVDAAKIMEKNSPHGITGRELLHEYVHLNFKGNFLLAKAVFEQIEKILPTWVTNHKLPDAEQLTQQQCAELMAYTDWDNYRVIQRVLTSHMTRPPFTTQLCQPERLSRMQLQLKIIQDSLTKQALNNASAQYELAISKDPTDWWLHWQYASLLLSGLQNPKAAEEQYRLVLRYVPNSYRAHTVLANILALTSNLDAAIESNLEAIKIMPTYTKAYGNLAKIYQQRKDYDKAIDYYSKAMQIEPDPATCFELGRIFLFRKQIDKAIQTYQAGLLFAPNNRDLHYNLGYVLSLKGQTDQAVSQLQTALEIDPNSTKVKKLLKSITTSSKTNLP
ncbi:MAG: tetratricopeptide repeat protein [Planctomycetota bacterium]|jgi:tetratricopeptide (TPR) repeat protein